MLSGSLSPTSFITVESRVTFGSDWAVVPWWTMSATKEGEGPQTQQRMASEAVERASGTTAPEKQTWKFGDFSRDIDFLLLYADKYIDYVFI